MFFYNKKILFALFLAMDMPDLEGTNVRMETIICSENIESSVNVENSEESIVYLEEVESDNRVNVHEIEVVDDSSQLRYLLLQYQNKDEEVVLNDTAEEGLDKQKEESSDNCSNLSSEVKANRAKMNGEPVVIESEESPLVTDHDYKLSLANQSTSQTVPDTSLKQLHKKTNRKQSVFKKWDSTLTKSIIQTRKQMDDLFRKNKGNKVAITAVWNLVAKTLKETNPNNQTAAKLTWMDCADKWKNLVVTFRANLMKCRQEKKSSSWEHYDAMMDLMKNDTSSEFATLLKRMESQKTNSPASKRKFVMEQTHEHVNQVKLLGDSVTLTKKSESSPNKLRNIQPRLVNNQYLTFKQTEVQEDDGSHSADYHFAMLIVKELEKLPPDVRKRKKQRILLALYE